MFGGGGTVDMWDHGHAGSVQAGLFQQGGLIYSLGCLLFEEKPASGYVLTLESLSLILQCKIRLFVISLYSCFNQRQ